jgi:hypothetical protein
MASLADIYMYAFKPGFYSGNRVFYSFYVFVLELMA